MLLINIFILCSDCLQRLCRGWAFDNLRFAICPCICMPTVWFCQNFSEEETFLYAHHCQSTLYRTWNGCVLMYLHTNQQETSNCCRGASVLIVELNNNVLHRFYLNTVFSPCKAPQLKWRNAILFNTDHNANKSLLITCGTHSTQKACFA